jgi:hypothetical protein
MGKGKDNEKCETCLDKPVKYCSAVVSVLVILAGVASCFLVPYFGGLVESPFEPAAGGGGGNNGTVTAAPTPAPMAPTPSTSISNATSPCDLSSGGGLGVLGFLLINHGVVAAIIGGMLLHSWTSDTGMLSGNFGKAIGWFFAGTLLLGLGLTFWVPNLGGPQHVLSASIYFAVTGFSYLMTFLFLLRKCCSDVGRDNVYANNGGFNGA